MDYALFDKSPIGRLVPIAAVDDSAEPLFAYVPDPLPAEPKISLSAINAATNAAMAVARLDQAMSQLPRPQLLVRPTIRREAVSTSALEGTYAAFDDVLEADFLSDAQLSREQREVRNYVHATERAIELRKKYPISRNMLGELQKIIVDRTVDDSYEAGDLRQHQVAIGSRGAPIKSARLVPCPPGPQLEEGFSEWEKWVNADNNIPALVKVSLAHYQFETLHPYNNGNGRLGRMIAILQLMQEGILREPILNLAPWLDEHRREYIDGLKAVSIHGSFDPWIEFMSAAAASEAADGMTVIGELVAFKDETVSRLRAARIRSAALELAEILIGYPIIDVPTVALILGKTYETANQAVARLVDFDILREMTGRKMNRLFACPRVLRLLSRRLPGS